MKKLLSVFFLLSFMAVIAMPNVQAAPENTPSGWSKGKKTGWNDAALPPGQAGKAEPTDVPTDVPTDTPTDV